MKKAALLIPLLIAAVILHAAVFLSPWGERLEMQAVDFWFNLRGPLKPPGDIVLVALDEDSYEELGVPMNQAWPRSLHARLLKRLARAGAKRAVFDVLFLGQSEDSGADSELAQALSGLPSVIGADLGTTVGEHKVQELFLPYEPFRAAVSQVAIVGLPEDYGVVRRFNTAMAGPAKGYPSLAEAAAGYSGMRPEGLGPRDFINYYGPRGTIETYSYYEALDPDILPDSAFKDKIVFIGIALRTGLGPDQKDSFLTPFNSAGRTFGVEIHATAAGNLLQHNWIKRFSAGFELLYLSGLLIVLGALIFLIRPVFSWTVLLFGSVVWAAVTYNLFLRGLYLPGALLFTVFLPLLFLASTLYYYFVVLKAKRQTERAFGLYLPAHLAKEVAKRPDALKPGGESVVATAMFTDIQDFTSITEKMSAEDVAAMLNSYFTDTIGAIFEEDGTLIKFIGDAVFAIWGAPIRQKDHATRAVRAAVAIQKRVNDFNSRKEYPELITRIGIHSGKMVVGNLGSDRRFDYTAIGDSVNLASRLEGVNKAFGTRIIISEDTKRLLDGSFETVRVGAIAVKGKSEVVGVYAVFEEKLRREGKQLWQSALEKFSERDWDKAYGLFEEVKQAEPRLCFAADYYLLQVADYSRRDQKYLRDTHWRGEIVFKTK
ncbi:MAG: adenylate/guanylate cyclase domain-containing protein [Candidatus Dadabacteria bacterium]|nr:MAG: adenylate/guanylate cyclase domain-containing protein [Candidatus Dadabacteria bacterium]